MTLQELSREIVRALGVLGFTVENEGLYTIQDLPTTYCLSIDLKEDFADGYILMKKTARALSVLHQLGLSKEMFKHYPPLLDSGPSGSLLYCRLKKDMLDKMLVSSDPRA